LAYFAGPAADLEWRRGWSHGVLAVALLPFLLTGCLLLLHRAGTAKPRQLLLLSFISVLSHPILDTLNTYGVRWLMPFSDRWFYGDTLFIVDPWLWLALALGVFYTARREKAKRQHPARPVRLAIACVIIYAGLMGISGVAARLILSREVAPEPAAIESIMAGPVPLTPLVREFVVEQEGRYLVGTFRWMTRPHANRADLLTYPRGWPSHPAATLAAETQLGRRFLGWARFPTVTIQQVGDDSFIVHIVDLRYARRPGQNFGTVSIPVRMAVRR
jgi:inner membrane protein